MLTLNEFIKNSSSVQRTLNFMEFDAIQELREKWLDEASDFAIAGNPRRAAFIYMMAGGA